MIPLSPGALPFGRTPEEHLLVVVSYTDGQAPNLRAHVMLTWASFLVREQHLTRASELLGQEADRCGEAVHWAASLRIFRGTTELSLGAISKAEEAFALARAGLDSLPPSDVRRVRRESQLAFALSNLALVRGNPRLARDRFEAGLEFLGREGEPQNRTAVELRTVAIDRLEAMILMAVPDYSELAIKIDGFLARPGLEPEQRAAFDILRGIGLAWQSRGRKQSDLAAIAALGPALDVEGVELALRMRGAGDLAQAQLRTGDVEGARQTLAAWLPLGEREAAARSGAIGLAIAISQASHLDAAGESSEQAYAWVRDCYDELIARWDAATRGDAPLSFLHHGERRVLLAELIRHLLRIHGPDEGARAALLEVMRAQAQGSAARRMDYHLDGVPAMLEALLRPGRGLLVFVGASDGGFVFAVDQERIVAAPIRGDARLAPTLEDFNVALRPRASAQAEADLAGSGTGLELARAILPEAILARVRTWTRIVVVGTSSLGYVPIELLPLPDGSDTPRRLFETHAVAYLDSLPIGELLARRDRTPGDETKRRMLLLVADQPRPGLTGKAGVSLPWSRRHEDELLEPYGREATLLRGSRATLALLRKELPGTGEVLHLVAHGTGSGSPVLHLADGPVQAHELFEGAALPPLVILSICKAGAGLTPRGEDSNGSLAAEAALEGQARCVIAPHRDLEFQAAMRLVARVQAHLEAGQKADQALRLAKLDLATDDVADHTSYMWMHVVGLPD